MGNSLGIEVFRSQVDVCMTIDRLTSKKERDLLLEKVFGREEVKGRYLVLGGCPEDVGSGVRVDREFLLVFVRLSMREFRKLMLESAGEFPGRIRLSVMLSGQGGRQESLNMLRDGFGEDLERFEVVFDERTDSFDPLEVLVSNFESEDFLERYTFKDGFVKTLGLFNCLDEQELVRVRGQAQMTNLSHFIHINIGQSYTEFLHYGEGSRPKRVGGIEIGEYTLWGLAEILDLKVESMEDIDRAISLGNIQNCDLIVKDIYGQSYPEINLEEDSVASSLGKLQFLNCDQRLPAPEDLVKSVVILLTNQLVQKGMLHSQILQENNVVISGFVSGSPKIMAAIHNTFRALSEDFNVSFIKSVINTACIRPRVGADS